MKRIENFIFLPGWGFSARLGTSFFARFPDYKTDFIEIPWGEEIPTMEEMCSRLENKMDSSSKILVGWSFGGLLALKMAERCPERYPALILIASTPCFTKQGPWPGVSERHQSLFEKHLNRSSESFMSYFLKLVSSPFAIAPQLRSHVLSPTFLRKAYDDYTLLFRSDLREICSTLQTKILFIQGGRDALVPSSLWPHLKNLNRRVDAYLIPEASHLPFLTHPTELEQRMTSFLRTL